MKYVLRLMGLAIVLGATFSPAASLEKATFAGGCFWGMEEFFRNVKGVTATRVGYTGGPRPATYEQVCEKNTGHAEALEMDFDPRIVSYDELLNLFFNIHDPTTPNQQGNDKGPQYRSAIFTHGEAQLKAAKTFMAKVEKSNAWKAHIVTEIKPAGTFYPAEPYHQQYLKRHVGGYDNHTLRNYKFD